MSESLKMLRLGICISYMKYFLKLFSSFTFAIQKNFSSLLVTSTRFTLLSLLVSHRFLFTCEEGTSKKVNTLNFLSTWIIFQFFLPLCRHKAIFSSIKVSKAFFFCCFELVRERFFISQFVYFNVKLVELVKTSNDNCVSTWIG